MKDCSGYTLTKCPENAASCSECNDGTTTKYKIDKCIDDRYVLYDGHCYPYCSRFDDDPVKAVSSADLPMSRVPCMVGSALHYAYDGYNGIWITREYEDGLYGYDCKTTLNLTGTKDIYVGLSDKYGSCTSTDAIAARCDNLYNMSTYNSDNLGKRKICGVYGSNGTDDCGLLNNDRTSGTFNANISYGSLNKSVTIRSNDQKNCNLVIKDGSNSRELSTVNVIFY